MTIRNKYSLPQIDDMFDQLQRAKLFQRLIFNSGIISSRLESDIHKIALRSRYKHYEFLVISFGLTNSLAAYMDLINRMFRSYLDKKKLLYLSMTF